MIDPDDTWTLWAVIIVCTAGAIWLERSYQWAAAIGGPVLALASAMLLSNTGVMPTESTSYAFVGDYLVPLSIPLLLMRANIVRILRDSGWMLIAFHFSVLGTIVGAAIATVLLHPWIEGATDAAAIMSASYIGGAVNFFAVKESFDISESLTNPLLVADNVIMAGMLLALVSIAGNSWFRRTFPASPLAAPEGGLNLAGPDCSEEKLSQGRAISVPDIAGGIAIAVVVVALANLTSSFLRTSFATLPAIAIFSNLYVLVAFYSVLAATLLERLVKRIVGYEELGGFLLYLFLFAIGLPADIPAVISNAPILLLFCLIMAVSNLLVTLILGRLMRIHLEDLLICVNASLGGPPTAIAFTIAMGWRRLTAPALLVGIWGYVIGTPIGIVIGEALRQLY